MAKAKSDYYTNLVSNYTENPHQLWNCINKILHRVPAPTLHSHVSIKCLCDSFSSHFKNSLIRSAFPDHSLNPVQVDPPQVNSLLYKVFNTKTIQYITFKPTRENKVVKI